MATKTTTNKTTKTRAAANKNKEELKEPVIEEVKEAEQVAAEPEVKAEEKVENIAEAQQSAIDSVQFAQALVGAVQQITATATPKPENTDSKKKFEEEDLILCSSITGGELIHIGAKSGIRYTFAGHGDTCEIEVRDLNSLRASRSDYLYKPLFIIQDEEFISQPRFKEIKNLYESIMINDVNKIIDMPLGEFKQALVELPSGFKKALIDEVATRIHNDEFDSLYKIRAIDEICGTDLNCLIR